jgi:hypothetical protein
MEEQEVKDAPKVEVKDVGEINPDINTPQQKEAAVLEQAVDEGKVDPAYGLQKDGVYKINVDKPPVPKKEAKLESVKKVKEEPKKEEKNAIQESETKGSVLRDEQSEVGLQGVGSEVRETPKNAEGTQKEEVEITKESTDSPLELITEEPKKQIKQEKKEAPVKEEKILQEEKQPELPEGVEKLVQFMEETGGTVEDYTKLNRDYSKIDNVSLLQEYYEYSKPHLNQEDINFLMDKNFAYDEETDDPSDIKAKQLAFKEELFKAKDLLKKTKEKYYTDLKLRSKQQNISPEYQKALEYYNNSQQFDKQAEEAKSAFIKETNNVFNEEFKGFDFKVGENKYRVKVDDAEKLKTTQSNLNNFLNPYIKDGKYSDIQGYHKAIFTAQNADKIANHFYEQGRADAIKDAAKKAKNINMDPRQEGSTVVTNSGDKIRVVSGESSDKLRIKWK